MKSILLTMTVLLVAISLLAEPKVGFMVHLSSLNGDSVCRDTNVCLTGGPFNLNRLCRPTGGVYWGSPAVLGDQFIPISANIGTNLIYHGYLSGIDTVGFCSFTVSVIDTVYPAGIIAGAGTVCRGKSESYNVAPIENATLYLWNFSGSAISDSITVNPSITLNFNNTFNSGLLKVRGMASLCKDPGIASDNFFIHINEQPAPTIRNAGDTVNVEDYICKHARVHYYVVEEFKGQLWKVGNGKIIGDSTSRNVTIDWGDKAGNGSLAILAENADGCSGSSVRHVVVGNETAPAPPTIWLFGYNMLVCSDSLVNSYQWYHENVLIQGAVKRYFLADTNDRKYYHVQTCSDACCNMSDPFSFYAPSSIDDVSGIGLRIFPNPVTDKVQVRIAPAIGHPGHLFIYNKYGTLVNAVKVGSGDFQVDMSGLPGGLYFFKLFNGLKGVTVSKVLKF